MYCEDVDDDAFDSYYAVDQWWSDIDCDCSCYHSTSPDYHGAPAFLCIDNIDNSELMNPRCGGWIASTTARTATTAARTTGAATTRTTWRASAAARVRRPSTPSPTVTKSPTLQYYAVNDRGCSDYVRLHDGWYGGYYIANYVDLEECANAVHAYDGFDGCMGEHFYWASYDGNCACARARRVLPRANDARLSPRPLLSRRRRRARGAFAQATARRTPAPRATTTTTTAIARRTTASAPAWAATAVRATSRLG